MKETTKLKLTERLFRFGIVATAGAIWYMIGYLLRMYVPFAGEDGVIYTDVFPYMMAGLLLLFMLGLAVTLIVGLAMWIWRG